MEKVWKELKKIESEAEHIHSETLKKSEDILALAKRDVEKLLSISEKQTEIEADELLSKYLTKSAQDRDASLKANEKNLAELEKIVEQYFDEAVDTVFDAVLGNTKV